MSESSYQTVDTSALYQRAQSDRVAPSLYYDPAVFETELERIFYKTWIWVAHESELPNPGDFRTTTIGRQPVIVVRDKSGAVNVLQNRCRHRGATVCEQHKGNAKGFTCPYHSWTYGLDGALRALPYGDGYEGVIDKTELPLASLRVGIYQGLIFASFNQEIEPLEDFLGGAKPWIDLFMKQGAGYPIKANGEHRFRFNGNWKIQLENTTDLYHFPVVHKSWMKSIDDETAAAITSFMTSDEAFCRSLGNGHSLAVLVPEIVDLDKDDGAPIPERFEELAAIARQGSHAGRSAPHRALADGRRLQPEPVSRTSRCRWRFSACCGPFPRTRPRSVTSPSPWTAAPRKRTACACAFTNTSRARSVSAARTTPKPGSACNAARRPAPICRFS